MARLLLSTLFILCVLCGAASAQTDLSFHYDVQDTANRSTGWWHVVAYDGMGMLRFVVGIKPDGELRGQFVDSASHCIRQMSFEIDAASVISEQEGFTVRAGKDVMYYLIDIQTKHATSRRAVAAGRSEAVDLSSYPRGIYVVVVEHDGVVATFRRFEKI